MMLSKTPQRDAKAAVNWLEAALREIENERYLAAQRCIKSADSRLQHACEERALQFEQEAQ